MGGGHYPDFFLVAPVFEGATLLGYVVTTAHHVDVGGFSPGSQAVQGVTEAFQEGIRVLPVKLVHAGEFDPDLLRVILGNVRLPDKMRGDLVGAAQCQPRRQRTAAPAFRFLGPRPWQRRSTPSSNDPSNAHVNSSAGCPRAPIASKIIWTITALARHRSVSRSM